jgi:hypothetical protein
MGLLCSPVSRAQTTAGLETSDTRIQLQAGPHAPKLSTLQHGSTIWTNRALEAPMANVELSGQNIPVEWNFNAAESRSKKTKSALLTDSSSPNLRFIFIGES